MSRGRRPKLDTPKEWKLRIPTSVADAVVEQLSKQNILGTDRGPPLGARSELTATLYRRWLRERDAERECLAHISTLSPHENPNAIILHLQHFLSLIGYNSIKRAISVDVLPQTEDKHHE